MLLAKSIDKLITEYDRVEFICMAQVHHHQSFLCGRLDLLHLCSIQKLEGYNPAYTEGPRNLRMSSFKDHAVRTMHIWAMSLHLAKYKNI